MNLQADRSPTIITPNLARFFPTQCSNELRFMVSFFERAHSLFMRHYRDAHNNFAIKADASYVTKGDTEINDLLIEMVQRSFPGHSVDGEEKTVIKNSRYKWVCDPVDGTMHFTNGLPISVISLALTEDNKTIVAATYEPHSGRLTYAELGKGTYCNGERIVVTPRNFGPDPRCGIILDCANDHAMRIIPLLTNSNARFTAFACAVLGALEVARNHSCAYLFIGGKDKHVDIAATSLLVTEAGGKVTDPFGNPLAAGTSSALKGVLFSNGVTHDLIVSALT
jgi:myo-inositol-1(or 4)-monophosphatase